ncbi:MAG: DUF192 domain-containing protein [Treponema sp.]|nr:DUF192 domain-containing protein [Treponema sp.]
MTFRAYLLVLAFCLLSFSRCTAGEDIQFEKRELVLEGSGASATIVAEIARTGKQRERGLMFRKELKDGEGMLFIFERDQILSFWMKNTLVPLSIAYISRDGVILEIRDLEPGNLRPVASSRSCRYALEVPRGWFHRAGLGPGDRLASFPQR